MKQLHPSEWSDWIRPGSRVYVGAGAGFPRGLVEQLLANAHAVEDIEIVHGLVCGGPPWLKKPAAKTFLFNALALDPESARAVRRGTGDFTPCFSSEIPGLFLDGIIPLDVALIHVSPPDSFGYCSLGPTVETTPAAIRAAHTVIAQINPAMPRTHGQSFVHVDEIDAFIENEEPLPEIPPSEPTDEDRTIGRYVARLVRDGSTIHVGEGALQSAILEALGQHSGLGLHTETLTDGFLPLLRAGVISNRNKTIHPRKSIVARCLGTGAVYDYVADNPHVELHPTEYVNSPATIARNDNMVSITGAREIDLSGQVVAESAGQGVFSGVGSMADFFRGAAMSRGGVPIIALRATRRSGKESNIRASLHESAGIATSRGHVHFVVTEFGVATLRGRSIRERALELIQVAHPDFRDKLLQAAVKRGWVPAYQKAVPRPVADLGDLQSQTVELRGKRFVLRPLHSSDIRRLQEFFYSHTLETIQMRYGYAVSRMSRGRAYELVNVDQSKDLALGVFETQGPREIIHAVGRYYLDKDGRSAEVAFVVRETMRRHGMASLLLRTMLDVGARRGIERFWGRVRKDNLPMIALFRHFGGKPVPSEESSPTEVTIEIPVSHPPSAEKPTSSLTRKARGPRRRRG